ncbi:MAG: adenylyltransferase/cytidyltransferase family protein [Rikenellaceae bacterium]|nr:adenylyltransferase/cytidyltransferase family protein [Rikenellaceae bacterium]
MRVFRSLDEIRGKLTLPAVTVGSFDGVHRGHMQIVNKVIETAKETGGESLVITFDPHPREVVNKNGNPIKLLTTVEEKIYLLGKAGIENIFIIDFNSEFSRMSYSEFAEEYLLKSIGARNIIAGYNHHYGHKRRGDKHNLESFGDRYDFMVYQIPMYGPEEVKVSSTTIRTMIAEGALTEANKYLWQDYTVFGEKVSDNELLVRNNKKLLPPDGTYCTAIENNGITSDCKCIVNGRNLIFSSSLNAIPGNTVVLRFQS